MAARHSRSAAERSEMNNTFIQPRGKFHGVMQIVAFNWRFYLAAGVVLVVSFAALQLVAITEPWRLGFEAGLLLTTLWLVASLVVSHWVYDLSKIYQWRWLHDCLPQAPGRWVNIHAGLDESSASLAQVFPGAAGRTFDIFDPVEMTESSIAEARAKAGKEQNATPADFRALPLPDGKLDAVFLIFAAHEIRNPDSRLRFFRELRRVLDRAGRVVLVEHMRDWRNFLAYGPGCFHFFSRRTWLSAASESGLVLEKEFGMTPFVRTFVFQKNHEP
jgi:SAM-dependent methyltransferase